MNSVERLSQPLQQISLNTQSFGKVGHSKDVQLRFNKLVTKGKELAGQGYVRKALEYNKKAIALVYNEKLAKRIKKMELFLQENEKTNGDDEDDSDGDMYHLGEGFYLYKDLFNKLYPHQKQGVLWFWGLYLKKKGGILGDDMGLGKTIQVISFLSGMFDAEKVHSVLIVMPVSLIMNWEREFEVWAPGIRVSSYHGNSKKERERCLSKVQRRGGVCLTSYGMVVSSWELLSQQDGRHFVWDYVILDEGHKIKNPTKTSKGVHAITAQNRVILTGTPIQNNLRELWALFDFVHQGMLLGTSRTFKMEYENPITRARERDSTVGEKRLGSEIAESLKRIIAPYFLRRTKAEVQDNTDAGQEVEQGDVEQPRTPHMPTMSRKNDFIIWVYLSETQQKIYQDFLSLDEVKELLMTNKSPLVALNVLKKVCDHPRLLSTHACAQLGLDGEHGMSGTDINDAAVHLAAATRVNEIPDETLIRESGKMVFLVELLDNLKAEGHRCLVFSQSRKMLDIIQKVIENRGHKVIRLDGTITHLYEREQRINKFQADKSYSVFLLTTQVGGVGLTLTAADRVVIFDPSWNPATDAQAVDRAFRIGQDKNVVIYRFITCGSVEEKIYRRQVFKDSITRQTTGNSKNPFRYFTKQDLHELFTLDNPRRSKTQEQLQAMHSHQRTSDTKLDGHIAFLHSLEMFGISDHDLMFSQEAAHETHDVDHDVAEDYIQSRVQKAQHLIHLESTGQTTSQVNVGNVPVVPVFKPVPDAKRHPTRPPGGFKELIKPSPHVDLTNRVTGDEVKRVEPEVIDLTNLHVEDKVKEQEEDLNNTLANLTLEDEETPECKAEDLGSPQNPIIIKSEPSTPAKQSAMPTKTSPLPVEPPTTPSTVISTATPSKTSITPGKLSTPARPIRTIEEELIISPDAKYPIINTSRVHELQSKRIAHSPCVNPDIKKHKSILYLSPASLGKPILTSVSELQQVTKESTSSNLDGSINLPYHAFVDSVQERPNSTVLPGPGAITPVFVCETPDLLSASNSPCVAESPSNDRVSGIDDNLDNGSDDVVVCESDVDDDDGGDEDDDTPKEDSINKSITIHVPNSDGEDNESDTQPDDTDFNTVLAQSVGDNVGNADAQGSSPTASEVNHDNETREVSPSVGDDSFHSAMGEEEQAKEVIEAESGASEGEAKSDDLNMSGDASEYDDDDDDDDEDRDLSDFVVPDDDEGEESGSAESSSEGSQVGDEESGSDGESEEDELSAQQREQFELHRETARTHYKRKDYKSALLHLLKAIKIYPEEHLQIMALKIKQKLGEQ